MVPFLTLNTVMSFGLDGVLPSVPGPSGSTSAVLVIVPAGIFKSTLTLNFKTPPLLATTVGTTNVTTPPVTLYLSASTPSVNTVPLTVAEPAT